MNRIRTFRYDNFRIGDGVVILVFIFDLGFIESKVKRVLYLNRVFGWEVVSWLEYVEGRFCISFVFFLGSVF